MLILICRLLGIGRISIKHMNNDWHHWSQSFACFHVLLCYKGQQHWSCSSPLSPELLQGSCAKWTPPQWVVLVGLCRVPVSGRGTRSTVQRCSECLFLSPLLSTTDVQHPLDLNPEDQYFQTAACHKNKGPETKGITNYLGHWHSEVFAQLACKGRSKSNPTIPTSLCIPEHRSKVRTWIPRKGFSASHRGLAQPA